jgi:hypothetical protein
MMLMSVFNIVEQVGAFGQSRTLMKVDRSIGHSARTQEC